MKILCPAGIKSASHWPQDKSAQGEWNLIKLPRTRLRALAIPLTIVFGCSVAVSQTNAGAGLVSSATLNGSETSSIEILLAIGEDPPKGGVGEGESGRPHGLIMRSVRRGLEDQKELYSAPF